MKFTTMIFGVCLCLGVLYFENAVGVKGPLAMQEHAMLQRGITALRYSSGPKDLHFERCFQILWLAPKGAKRTTHSSLRLGTLAENLELEVSAPDTTNNLVGLAVSMGRDHGRKRRTYKISGRRLDQFLHKNVTVTHGKVVRRVETIVLFQACLKGVARSGEVLEHVEVQVRYREDRLNNTKPSTEVEGGSLYLLEGTAERFAAQRLGGREVYGILTTQFPDAGYESFGVHLSNTHGWVYAMSLWWYNNGRAIAPVILKEYEDPNIRMVIPALDVSQFANNYGYSASWTGVEWGFDERRSEWTLMDPFGQVHEVTGAQNEYETIPVGGMTPVMIYSRQREGTGLKATAFYQDQTWVHEKV